MIGFLVGAWIFAGFWTAVVAATIVDKPFRTAVGIGLAWPVVFTIYAIRAVFDAISDAVSA